MQTLHKIRTGIMKVLGVLIVALFFNLTHKKLEEVHVELDKRHSRVN